MTYSRYPEYEQRRVGEALDGMAEMMGRAPGRPGSKVEEPEGDGPPHERASRLEQHQTSHGPGSRQGGPLAPA